MRFVSPRVSQAVLAAVRGNSVDDIRELDFGPPKCLGQCLKKIELEHWTEMDFLSKVPFVHNDRIVLCRNYAKRFTTGLSYWGTHSLLLRYPALHVAAQWVGLKSEKASRLLEDITCLKAMLTESQL